MKIAIFGGTGSVGSYFAMQLERNSNCEVSIIAREKSERTVSVQKNGLLVNCSAGEINITIDKFKYVGSYKDLKDKEKYDLVIVSLKQPDFTSEIAKQIASITDNDSVIGIIANGLPVHFLQGLNLEKKYLNTIDESGKITETLEGRKIITIEPLIASHVIDNIVNITRPLDEISVAIGSPLKASFTRLYKLVDLFNAAGIKTNLVEKNIHKNILEKLQFALSVNILSALLERNLGEIFDDEKSQIIIKYAVELTNRIALDLGIANLRDYKTLKSIAVTRDHFSSMYRDIKSSKVPEIKALIDAPIELAEYIMEKKQEHNLPDLEPLKIMKNLLLEKTAKQVLEESDIEELFESANNVLENLAPIPTHYPGGQENVVARRY